MPHPPDTLELAVGLETWTVRVPSGALVPLRRTGDVGPLPDVTPRELVRAALAAPRGLDAPVRAALTPDDRVAVVLDERLPHVAELLAGVIEHLADGGVTQAQITVVTPPGESGNGQWVEELPDEFADVTLEAHDPVDRKKIAYVATTKAGRRVYLNRTVAEADAVVVLSGRGYDPVLGYSGGEAALFPALSDAETRAAPVEFATSAPAPGATNPEATEIAWLVGIPFFVQVIAAAGDAIAEVVVGLPKTVADGPRRQDAHWRFAVDSPADLVIAAVAGDPARVTFPELAKAVAAAARVVSPDGRIALLTTAAPELGEGVALLRASDDPAKAARRVAKRTPPDAAAAGLWAFAAGRASLFVAAGWGEDVTEDLFATALTTPAELQRLIDAAATVIVIPDANKSVVEVG